MSDGQIGGCQGQDWGEQEGWIGLTRTNSQLQNKCHGAIMYSMMTVVNNAML